MAIWLVRAGASGEYETKFLDEGKIYLTWYDLSQDIKKLADKQALHDLLAERDPDSKTGRIRNHVSQIWPLAHEMRIGDWVVLPSKLKAAIHIGKITGDYKNNPNAENPFFHFRTVDWFATDIPRSNFDQDILYSFGAFLTICRIQRNNAEERIKAMAGNDWKVASNHLNLEVDQGEQEQPETGGFDLEESANDQIAKYIIRKFKGHGLSEIIDAILRAKGYHTHISPPGPDKGVDILAAKGSLGFDSPKICVQVKSNESPLDRPTLDQLVGTMQNFRADNGLLVSWGGFKSSVDKEIPNQFFQVRLWDQKSIINELILNYDKLDEEIRAEIPLKRVWVLALPEES